MEGPGARVPRLGFFRPGPLGLSKPCHARMGWIRGVRRGVVGHRWSTLASPGGLTLTGAPRRARLVATLRKSEVRWADSNCT